ncbi:protein far1-related sequence 9 [Phtheirospermum japonicum]|uniref:Protein far1-related sequence 9 n=1 Tax=Phtheirospermum japonicum TaxID=374723 RepID=A0A830D9Y3_9LAMI|nr:protein far1-related sequence 9 [Phtheirospermum japonicum]
MILKKVGNKTCSLYDFVLNYENVQSNWRINEKVEDTRCRHGKPTQILKGNPLLTHAADVYRLTIYGLFEVEFVNFLNLKFVEQPSNIGNSWDWLAFKVKSHGESSRIRQVVMNKQTHEVKCSCHKFETMGILCKHILMVFNSMDVNMLPGSYILKSWMKNSRNRVNIYFQESGCTRRIGHMSEMVFVNQTMRSTYDLVQLSKSHSETRTMLTTMLGTTKDQIFDFVRNLNTDDATTCEDIPNDEQMDGVQVRNPRTAKSRGITNACITRHWDDKSKRGKGKRKSDTSSKFELI